MAPNIHITCKTCGHHIVSGSKAQKIACGNCWEDMQDMPHNADKVTCGACDSSWCERCDPAPGALCHTCHGRGYSTAPLL